MFAEESLFRLSLLPTHIVVQISPLQSNASSIAVLLYTIKAYVDRWLDLQVVNPHDKYYETMSYLPALSDADIARQVEYITYNNWSPCVEFDCIGVSGFTYCNTTFLP